MSELAIGVGGLTKLYGKVLAVNGLKLNVPRGSIYGFLGRNGAGKTSTIKMLVGLTGPTSGSAYVLGMDIRTSRLPILRRTAFVSEKKTLPPSLTPAELVRFSRGFYPTWSDEAVEKYGQLLEIPMQQRFDRLSNGNQTKVFLLLALAQGAELLILDEPTTALDPVSVDQLLRLLAADAADRGTTVFFSSHQLEEVEQIAEYVGMVEGGRLLMESRLDDVKSDFRVITAAGSNLPQEITSQVLSVEVRENFYRYVITKDGEGYARNLARNGATVTNVAPLRLREIFLELMRKEKSCISGNAGETPVLSSSSF
jgi:ABC-2 type transport system ATP-binding protein